LFDQYRSHTGNVKRLPPYAAPTAGDLATLLTAVRTIRLQRILSTS
jgi:hypothetical protein